ncbi:MAG: hypothetical protein HY905_03840 [Deltaproteobacteria bacterium]|nr:hypothetical protein [Deltaproteobacteria bacterium]
MTRSASAAWIGCLGLVGATVCGCSGIRSVDTAGVPTVTAVDLGAETVGEALGRVAQGGAVVVRFAPGDTVPLKMETDLPFATIEAGENVVRFERDVYLYVGPGAFLVSPDAERWAEAGVLEAIKELFGAATGTFQFGFGARAGEPAAFTLSVGLR